MQIALNYTAQDCLNLSNFSFEGLKSLKKISANPTNCRKKEGINLSNLFS